MNVGVRRCRGLVFADAAGWCLQQPWVGVRSSRGFCSGCHSICFIRQPADADCLSLPQGVKPPDPDDVPFQVILIPQTRAWTLLLALPGL